MQRDVDEQRDAEDLRRGLARKNRYNLRTIALFTLVRWFAVFVVLVIGVAAIDLHDEYGMRALAAGFVAATVFGLSYAVLVERLAGGFRRLAPQLCSIYDPYFWWHERLWKLLATPPFAGTPFKPLLARMLGVRVGRRVLDLGCSMPEKTLVEIGDHVTLNEGTIIQCHSLEDGVFKSDRTVVGSGVTVGVAAFVHYGVSVGDGAVIGADAFLMKGEEVEPAARWAGNPAREVPEAAELPSLPAARRSAVAPLVLAGLVAVALPAGVTIGMTGTNLPFVPAALTSPTPPTSAVPAADAAGDDTTEQTGAAGTEEADDTAASVKPASVTTARSAPAARRAAPVTAAVSQPRVTALPTTKATTTSRSTTTTRTTTTATPTSKTQTSKTQTSKTQTSKTQTSKTQTSKTQTSTTTASGDGDEG